LAAERYAGGAGAGSAAAERLNDGAEAANFLVSRRRALGEATAALLRERPGRPCVFAAAGLLQSSGAAAFSRAAFARSFGGAKAKP